MLNMCIPARDCWPIETAGCSRIRDAARGETGAAVDMISDSEQHESVINCFVTKTSGAAAAGIAVKGVSGTAAMPNGFIRTPLGLPHYGQT